MTANLNKNTSGSKCQLGSAIQGPNRRAKKRRSKTSRSRRSQRMRSRKNFE